MCTARLACYFVTVVAFLAPDEHIRASVGLRWGEEEGGPGLAEAPSEEARPQALSILIESEWRLYLLVWSMILSDLASPAEAGFAKAGNRFSLFGILLYPASWSSAT